jgi:tetratricopeptide (TPR) repeat protein
MAEDQDFLLRSIEDLDAERDAGDIDEHDYATLRDSYVARAAEALQEHEDEQPALTNKRSWRTPAIVSVILAFGVVAAVLLGRNAGTRLPGDNISGSTPSSPVAKLNAQAQALVQKSDILDAIKTYDQALKIQPNNPEALAYKGWLLRLAGSQAGNTQLIDSGLASIRLAEKADPGYPDAHFFAGETLLRDKSDPRDAITEFEQFLADNPPQAMVPEVQLELQSAQQALAPTSTP